MNKFLVIIPFAYLWFWVFNSVHLEWSTNPQYSYGWVVPILCAGLVFRNWTQPPSTLRAASSTAAVVSTLPAIAPFLTFLFVSGLFLFLPARLVAATTPEWRPLQWILALIAVGSTLYIVRLLWGKQRMLQVAFPICFFLVAVPWPTPIEHAIIQRLTSLNASVVVELMGIVGIPAIQHGNVIEVGSGNVGIDEACSGIRSFQSSLMISLFLGEFYRLRWSRRGILFAVGILVSFAFNVCRTSFLTWIAAKKGVAAIAAYHDPAGLAILVACTLTLWLVSLYLSRAATPPSLIISPPPSSPNISAFCFRVSIFMVLWLSVVEIGTQLWFSSRESKLALGPDWTIAFPEKAPSFKPHKIGEKTYALLRYDQGKEAEWQDSSGGRWYAYYFDWLPGRIAGYLAKRHTPEACLTGTGQTLKSGPDLFVAKVHNLPLPIRQYLFDSSGIPVHVFHCRWEAGADQSAAVQHETTRMNLVRGIWAGRGKQGQKVFEIIMTGYDSPTEARAALLRQLELLVQVQPTKSVAKK